MEKLFKILFFFFSLTTWSEVLKLDGVKPINSGDKQEKSEPFIDVKKIEFIKRATSIDSPESIFKRAIGYKESPEMQHHPSYSWEQFENRKKTWADGDKYRFEKTQEKNNRRNK